MSPAYHHLQFVLLDKREHVYQQGDVVAFCCDGLHAVLVKRIAACPGQTVVIHEGKLYVNSQELDAYEDTVFSYAGILAKSQTLDTGEYIVIGDNIDESVDSRYESVGIVRQSSIIGRVITQ